MEEPQLFELIGAGRLDLIGRRHGIHDTSVGTERPSEGCGSVAAVHR
jgi:hypothetical protein